jgi:hypothetical protein
MSEMTADVVGATLDTLADAALGSSPATNVNSKDKAVEAAPTGESKTADSQPAEAKTTEDQSSPVNAEVSKETVTAKTIPYERFKEVNDTLKSNKERMDQLEKEHAAKIARLEAELKKRPVALSEEEKVKQDAIKTLEDNGFVRKDDIIAEMEKKQAKALAKAEADKRLELELTGLEKKYAGKVYPKFNRNEVIKYMADNKLAHLKPEQAYIILHQEEVIDARIKQAMAKNTGVTSEASDGSGARTQNLTDLKKAMLKGDKKAKETYLQALTS